MKYPLVIRLGVFLAAAAIAASASAGTVKVKAVYSGEVPKLGPVDMGQDKICVEHHKDSPPPVNEILVLGEGQTLGNVLVEVSGGLPEGHAYPVPGEPVVLTQLGCRYSPRMFGIRAGQPLKILNPDGTLHNVNAQPRVNPPFNRGMPANVQEIEVTFEKPEPMFVFRCNVHPWMLAYCVVLDHPYFAVTDAAGAAAIADLPPGKYEIKATHEVLGEQKAEVEVTESGDAEVSFTFQRPARRNP